MYRYTFDLSYVQLSTSEMHVRSVEQRKTIGEEDCMFEVGRNV